MNNTEKKRQFLINAAYYLLIAAILDYLQYLERAGVLNPGESWCEIDLDAQTNWLRAQGVEVGDMTEQEIREYQTGSWVFIAAGGRLVDAIEDFQVTFNTLVTVTI